MKKIVDWPNGAASGEGLNEVKVTGRVPMHQHNYSGTVIMT